MQDEDTQTGGATEPQESRAKAPQMRMVLQQDNPAQEATSWVECGAFPGSEQQAIDAFTGPQGDPNRKRGIYKAVLMSHWQGGRFVD